MVKLHINGWHQLAAAYKLDGVITLLTDPSQCNYTTKSNKIAVTLEPIMQFIICHVLECLTLAAIHNLLYD